MNKKISQYLSKVLTKEARNGVNVQKTWTGNPQVPQELKK